MGKEFIITDEEIKIGNLTSWQSHQEVGVLEELISVGIYEVSSLDTLLM